MTPSLVARPEHVTPEWLTDVLRSADAIDIDSRVVAADGRAIGTGQVGTSVRYALDYDGPPGPPTLVGKFASDDPASAQAGIASLTYETEVSFYRDLAPTVDVSRPRCYFAAVEPGTADTVLVLEDVAPASPGDQIAGASFDQAEHAVVEAARLHGPRWGDPRLLELAWLTRERAPAWIEALPTIWDHFVAQYEGRLDPVTLEQGGRIVTNLEALTTAPAALTAIHGDFRLDNLMFHPDNGERPVTVLDWQTVRLGAGALDVAYLLGTSFADADERRTSERALVERYHDILGGYGVSDYSLDACWTEYRRYAHAGLLMAILASTAVGRTKRGDTMFMAMANRSAQMADDLDTATLLARAG